MLSAITKVKNALTAVSGNVFHYEATGNLEKYIVWAEEAEASAVAGDNKKLSQAISGTIDLFTKEENDAMAAEIQTALNNAEISFSLNSVQYEDETGFVHYEWIFEVV